MNFSPDKWYLIPDIETIDSPALVIYEDRVKQNIETVKRMTGDVSRLRVHVKTHKNPQVTALQLDAGITKFKCATIAEAEMLAGAGAPDVLLAYQPVGPMIIRFVHLIKQYPNARFSCLVDDLDIARQLSKAMAAQNIQLPVYLDLNVGMNRTGITPDEKALQLYRDCALLSNIRPAGLHVYDGHIRDADVKTRTHNCNAAFAPVETLARQLKTEGFATQIIAGGTPTFPIHADRANVECSPGTFIYWDKGYGDQLQEQSFLYAALLICRVISLPEKDKICVDAGHKAVAAENELKKRIYFLNAPDLEPISQSEEHLVLNAGNDHGYRHGDVLYGVPYHICPTVALHQQVTVVKDHQITGEWKNTSRNRKLTI